MEHHQRSLTADIAPEDWAATPASVKRLLENLLETTSPAQPLTARDRLLTQFLEALPIGVAVHDPTGQLIYMNQAGMRIVDIDSMPMAEVQQLAETFQIYRSTTQTLYPTEELPVVRALKGEIVQVDDVEIHLENRVMPLAVQAIAIRDEQGQPTYAIATYQDITERQRNEANRQRMEQALIESESRYRQVVQDQTDFILRSRPDTTITFANDALCQALGYSPEEVIDCPWHKFANAEDLQEILPQILHLTPENSRILVENRDRRADGQDGWTQWIHQGFFDEHGRLVDLQSVGRDITTLKRTEAALRASEEQLRLALDFTQMGIWDWDIVADRTLWNRNHFYLLGLDPDTTIATYQNWRDRVHPEDLTRIEVALQVALQNQTDYEAEYRVIYPDGAIHWMLGKGRALYDESGQPTRMIGVMLDITALKQAETALRTSEQRFRALVENASDVIVILNQTGHFCYASSSAQAILGYTDADVLGRHALEFVHPDDAEIIVQTIQSALMNPNVSLPAVEYRVRHRNGEWRIFEAVTRNLLEEAAIAGIVINCRDISDRKEAEEILRKQFNLLSLAQETAHMGVYEWDLVTNQAYWTPEMEQLMGLKLEPRPNNLDVWFAQLHPDDQARLEQLFPVLLQSDQQPGRDEYRFYRNGEERWIDARGFIVRDETGKALKMIGTNLDITDRKRAEAALYQREQEFRALAENAPDIIARFDRRLRHLYVNPAIEQATGLPPEALIGKTNRELGMPETQVSAWEKLFHRVFSQKQQETFDFDFPTPSGIQYYQSRCVPEFTPEGTVESILSIARNMTEQKRLELALRQRIDQEQALSRVVRAIRQSLDLNEIFSTATVEVARLLEADCSMVFRYEPGQLCWKPLGEFRQNPNFPDNLGGDIPDQNNAIANQLKQFQVIRVDDASNLTDPLSQKVAQRFPGSWLLVPLLVDQSIWGSLSLFRFTQPSPWTEEQSALAQTVADQLAIAIQQAQAFEQAQRELTERQQAEIHLRAALTEKEVLLKEIHHRVKNNLQIVSGLLQLQAQSFSDPQIISALRESQNRIESMSLIHKKLYTSSDLGQIDVADYIQSLALSLLTTYQIAPGTVSLQTEVEPVLLSLDQAIPCGLIINELVSNALKYAFPPHQPGEIHVKLCQVHQELVLTIQDNGVGLPENLNWEETQSLGLSLVHALATDQLDGTLEVDHSYGTTFCIRFPLL